MTKRSPTARPHADRIPRVPVGPLAPRVLGECTDWLAAQGYSPGSAAGIVNLLARLSVWMQGVDSGVDDVSGELLERFVVTERSRDSVCVTVKGSMSTMCRFLTDAGYLDVTDTDAGPLTPAQAAVAQWCTWMRDQRGLTEKTIAARCHYAAGLLDVVTATDESLEWGRLDAPVVNGYVAERGRPYGVVSRAHIVDAVRCLLRWALSTGRLDRDLSAGILKPAGTRRGLPRGVGAEQVAAVLAVCDPATAIGARDRAVVMILVRLGLRAGEVARLNLDDIEVAALLASPDSTNWTGRRDHALLLMTVQTGLRISEICSLTCDDIHLGAGPHIACTGKGRRQRITPLTKATVATMTNYLAERSTRPGTAIFCGPHGQPLSRDALEHRLTKHLATAAITCPGIATKHATMHTLRHTAAMNLLAAGVDVSVIALWLGHADTHSTDAYLHADMAIKQAAIDRTRPPDVPPGTYQPEPNILAWLTSL